VASGVQPFIDGTGIVTGTSSCIIGSSVSPSGVEQRAMEWTFNWTLLGAKVVADATIVEIRASFMVQLLRVAIFEL
jgi:hypothetical protein